MAYGPGSTSSARLVSAFAASELRQQVSELKCDVGYWKSRHADVVQKNIKLHGDFDQARAEIRQLKADRSNHLDDSQASPVPIKKRSEQPNQPAPKRRDYSHLPTYEETADVSDQAKMCACYGKLHHHFRQFKFRSRVTEDSIAMR